MSTYEVIANYHCHCGEGPYWHPLERAVYWNDNLTKRFFRLDPATGQHDLVYNERTVAACTMQGDGTLLLYMDNCTVAAFRGGKIEPIIEGLPDEPGTRFNDVTADPKGRAYAGTTGTDDRLGRLYRIDTDLSAAIMLEGISCPNGLGFTADLKTMFFTDSHPRMIWQFDYDLATGDMANQRPFVKLADNDGLPDGMVMDIEGCLWSALWDGGAVARFSPTGQEICRIQLPTPQITCPVWAGDDLNEMYVTSAGGQDQASYGELAGALFRIDPGVKGVADFHSRLGQ